MRLQWVIALGALLGGGVFLFMWNMNRSQGVSSGALEEEPQTSVLPIKDLQSIGQVFENSPPSSDPPVRRGLNSQESVKVVDALSQAEIDKLLQSIAHAVANKDGKALEEALKKLLGGAPGVGKGVLDSFLSGKLGRAEEKGAILLLQVAISLARKGHPEGLKAFDQDAELLLIGLVERAASSQGPDAEKLLSLLTAPGVLRGSDLKLVVDLFSSTGGKDQSASSKEALDGFLDAIFSGMDSTDAPLLESLLSAGESSLRIRAYDAILRLEPNRSSQLARLVPVVESGEANAILQAICLRASVEEIPKALTGIGPTDPPGVDYVQPLTSYIKRHSVENYEQDIVYLRGSNRETETFRSNTVAALNLATRSYGLDSRKALEVFSSVYRKEQSTGIRATALMGIASHWNLEDADGFGAFIALVQEEKDMGPFIDAAKENFEGRKNWQGEKKSLKSVQKQLKNK